MATSLHKDLDYGELHKPINYQYADATARTTATGFTAADVGKFAWQLDDDTIWMLTATTPTWAQVTTLGAAVLTSTAPVDVDKSAAQVGVGTEAARNDHKHDISTAAAIELTDATSAEGTATSLARSDHTHAHGNRGGGSLHALAVASGAAGFMTGADKQKLDDLPPIDTIDYQNVTGTASSPQSVNLPASPTLGDLYSYRDADGNASVNPITYNGNGNTINGETSCVMNADYGVLLFRFGTEWEIR